MANLTMASDQLFRRRPDELFKTLDDLYQHCRQQKANSAEHWNRPESVRPIEHDGKLDLSVTNGSQQLFQMNDWSFGQLCQLAKVPKDTINRLTTATAQRVFDETLGQVQQVSRHGKPLQTFTQDDVVRSIHGASYTRLHNVDLLSVVREYATDFVPPQETTDGACGIYCGEQDMFCFLIDPTGWAEIDGQAFAPGFFLWNSEVGKRSLGVQTFWFQAVCCNHIVWDAVEVVDFKRKHTANVHDSLSEIRRIIEQLVEKRNQRRDGFVNVMKTAMQKKLGDDAEQVLKILTQQGITRAMANQALAIAKEQGMFTVFALVDALTCISGQYTNGGERTEADQKASSLLALAV